MVLVSVLNIMRFDFGPQCYGLYEAQVEALVPRFKLFNLSCWYEQEKKHALHAGADYTHFFNSVFVVLHASLALMFVIAS